MQYIVTRRKALTHAAVLATAGISACANIQRDSHPPLGIAASPGSEGLLIGSISLARPSPFVRAHVSFFPPGGRANEALGWIQFVRTGIPAMDSRIDFRLEDSIGQIFALPMAAGTYEFGQVFVTAPYGLTGNSIHYRQQLLGLQFTIGKSQGTYIGNWNLISPIGVGRGLPTEAVIRIDDMLDRDLEFIRQKVDRSLTSSIDKQFPTRLLTIPATS